MSEVMQEFVTLEAAWECFKNSSDIKDVAKTPGEMEAAKVLFTAGCQGALYALANIKTKCEGDPVAAVPMIHDLYQELEREVRRIEIMQAAADLQEAVERNAQEEKLHAAWPFPTGTRQ